MPRVRALWSGSAIHVFAGRHRLRRGLIFATPINDLEEQGAREIRIPAVPAISAEPNRNGIRETESEMANGKRSKSTDTGNGGNLGFEAELFKAADKIRENLSRLDDPRKESG